MSLDWEGARARLRSAQERLNAIDHEVGDFETLLYARAEAIAAAQATPPRTDVADLVAFRIGSARYAVDAVDVSEVIDVVHLTALPGVPAFYLGLLSHRGVVFPLVDVRPLVGALPNGSGSFPHALLFSSETHTVAVGADEVDGLHRVERAAIAPSPAAAIRGTTGDGIVVLDIATLLADARLVVDG